MDKSCDFCGHAYADGDRFCSFCGRPLAMGTGNGERTTNPMRDGSLRRYPDGRWRWVCELSMFKQPVLLFLAWRVCVALGFVSFLILSAIRIFVQQTDIQTSLETVPEVMPSFGAGLIVTMLVVAIIYAMASAIHGGRYCVLYELDGNMLINRQLPARIRKDAVIDALHVLDTPSPITPEQVELQEKAFDDSIVTSLSSVSRIRGSRSHDLIVIRDSMGKNRVHVHSGDYAPIMDYLRRRCPKAKVSHQA